MEQSGPRAVCYGVSSVSAGLSNVALYTDREGSLRLLLVFILINEKCADSSGSGCQIPNSAERVFVPR